MQAFQPFDLERMMSKYENAVEYNLSESGAHPMQLWELLDSPSMVEDLLATELKYPQANGILELRENIASLYPGAGADNVLVTVGAAEANLISLQTIAAPGDHVTVMLPNYLQIWGCAKNAGMQVATFHLQEERGWAPDLSELTEAVSEKTRLIAVCNPNNPTGYILTEAEMDAIVASAERHGAWLLADEVYRGSERLTDAESATFWGRYDKVLAVGSLSKAYGLPGLRVGWVVAPQEMVDELWARRDYTTITNTVLANKLAAIALAPDVRPQIIQRARGYIRRGFSVLESWLARHSETFSLIPPQAAAIAFPRYNLAVNSTDLAMRLIKEKSVYIVPGEHFGLDHFVRISFGLPEDYLQAALDRVASFLAELRP